MPLPPVLIPLLVAAADLGCPAPPATSIPPDPVPDHPFLQETHQPLPLSGDPAANDVRAVLTLPNHEVWTATRVGVFVLQPGAPRWSSPHNAIGPHPCFALAQLGSKVWVGAWNGLHRGDADRLEALPGVDGPVAAIAPVEPTSTNPAGPVLLAVGPDGLWRIRADGRAERQALPGNRYVRAIVAPTADEFWIATGLGLLECRPAGATLHQGPETALSSDLRDLALGADHTVWVGGLGGVWSYRAGHLADLLNSSRGLPHPDVHCVAITRNGELWGGTKLGLARFDGRTWSLRHSRRWLQSDDVRDVVLREEARGELTAWIGTAAGVSRLDRRRITLAEKARHYHAACAARHVRPPGIVEKCRLRVPGDLRTWEPEDDDNDGGYTAVYLAMESFRYGATRDPEALANARRAFQTLLFLQEVTAHSGFIARSVIPSTWTHMHDPNETLSDPDWIESHVQDPRNKRVPIRWRPSADGHWLWKGDTSSDEVTAHLFGCFLYFSVAADDADRPRVSDFVRRLVDHIIAHGYQLVDLDGRPTRWGVWAPDKLWHDPDWANEAGINAVEILSYLKLAGHLTGNPTYENHYRQLLDHHRYRELVLRAKNLNPTGRTHIDDELLAFAWPALLTLENDPALLTLYRDALERWHDAVKDDHTPFFECLYAALTGRHGRLSTSIEFLRDQPLDLVRWTVDNSDREDLRPVRFPELEYLQTDRLLPPSERGTPRTDENPWRITQGDGGTTESDGVFWLLPYWMMRHHGFLQAP